VGTRTPDLYRVNFEVNNPKPLSYLAFPHFLALENTPKPPSFDGELMASYRLALQNHAQAKVKCNFEGPGCWPTVAEHGSTFQLQA
jgi:hypothetical protein